MKQEIFSLDEKFLASHYPDYAFKLYKILNAYNASKDRGYRIAKELVKSSTRLLGLIEKFQKQYVNSDDYLDDLNDIVCSLDVEIKKNTSYIQYKSVTANRDERALVIKKIYDSGLSLLDYFFYYSTPLGVATYFSEKCYEKNKVALEIKSRKDTTYPLIIDIIKKINNNEMDYVEYYEQTKLNPYYLSNIAKENGLTSNELSKFIGQLRANKRMDVESELNGILVINKQQVPRDIKEQAIEYLKSIEAPIDVVVYDSMVRRLVKKSQ